jgi:3-oxosteroid 1-dehydrogenase
MNGGGSWDESTDFVIIGSGAGGLCAALVAASLQRSAVVLEKEPLVGGTSARSGGGVWIPFNGLMAREGVPDSYPEARKYMENCIKEHTKATTPARLDAYLNTGPEMLDFLENQGVPFQRARGYSDYYDELPGGNASGRTVEAKLFDSRQLGEWARLLNRYAPFAMPVNLSEFTALSVATRTWRGKIMALRLAMRMLMQKWRGAAILGQGAALQGRLLKQVLGKGIPVLLESTVTELVVEGGKVVGVTVQGAAGVKRIRAISGVLIDAGGFSQNLSMRERYLPKPQRTLDYSLANPGDTGEMLSAAAAIGADVDQMDEAWWIVGSKLPDGISVSHTFDITKPHSIMVDARGQRYVDEAMAYMELGQRMYAHNNQIGAIPSWAIIESRHRSRYGWGIAMPGKTPQEWFDTGYMKRADTLADLARQCGLPAGSLEATVTRFNQFAADGRDVDFGRGNRAYDRMGGDPTCKPNPTLGPIQHPPFYAVQIYVGDVGTCGGVVTDHDARVLRPDGSPIEGLFACGNAAASCMGRSYPGAGVTLGQSLIFGYRAALRALRA